MHWDSAFTALAQHLISVYSSLSRTSLAKIDEEHTQRVPPGSWHVTPSLFCLRILCTSDMRQSALAAMAVLYKCANNHYQVSHAACIGMRVTATASTLKHQRSWSLGVADQTQTQLYVNEKGRRGSNATARTDVMSCSDGVPFLPFMLSVDCCSYEFTSQTSGVVPLIMHFHPPIYIQPSQLTSSS